MKRTITGIASLLLASCVTARMPDYEHHLHAIIFPVVDLRDASAADVVTFLIQATRQAAMPPALIESIGNIRTNSLSRPTHILAHVTDASPINYTATQISLYNVMKDLTAMVGIRFHVNDSSVTFIARDGTILNPELEQTLPPVSGTRGTPAAYAPGAPGIPER